MSEKSKRKKRTLHVILAWALWAIMIFLVWQIAADAINRPLILPAPFEVLGQMMVLVTQALFWKSLALTLLRTFFGVVVSMGAALVLAFICLRNKEIWFFVSKTVIVIQTIPMIALIILFLFWTGREAALILVIFFLLFPLFIDRLMLVLQSIRKRMKPFLQFFPNSYFKEIEKVYLPLLYRDLGGMLEDGWSLGLKSCVMAEVLASLSAGVGVEIQKSRLFLNVSGLMAWTIWLILFGFLVRFLIVWLSRRWESL